MANEDLIFQYAMTRKGVMKYKGLCAEKCKELAKQLDDELDSDSASVQKIIDINDSLESEERKKSIWASMSRSLTDGIVFMETGRFPTTDPDKKNKSRRTIRADEQYMSILALDLAREETEKEIGDCDRKMLKELLSDLTAREKEAYLLVYQSLIEVSTAASMLGVKKTTVETLLERAKAKIQRRKERSLYVYARGWAD
ncbi:sigma factor-like helix-turn-helix DNA-binding protein [Paenilisteria newyorkensis]|uniref:sigma factor-like helix-turn-helix DNA-binding protein n=1 Tax=Listeria newyorkensis TaxID=1497681 RepID=UPI000669EADB|nr:sigma factor-like helix-turn-helix DNA-binding protein [Listeria newyorkensis]KMT58912.1 positive control sigma-like factor [Listeria newyorkensis]